MSTDQKRSAEEVQRLIRAGLPMTEYADLRVDQVTVDGAIVTVDYHPWMLRPGGSIAGPVLMMLADAAMYAAVLGRGGEEMALTSDLSMRFLTRAQATDLSAEARLLKVGRRMIVLTVTIWNKGSESPIAIASGTYVRPVN